MAELQQVRTSSAAGGEDDPAQAGMPATMARRKPDLRADLRDFAAARPQGWQHEDWIVFLENLASRGHNIVDREAIGVALEKERLDLVLSRIKGVGPQRRRALIERYGTVWNLRSADVADIAAVANVPRNLAEAIKAGVG